VGHARKAIPQARVEFIAAWVVDGLHGHGLKNGADGPSQVGGIRICQQSTL
jgi:hypothetical protein